VNFRWTFTFCVEKLYDGTHLAFGGTLDRRCQFKHVSLKQSRLQHFQTSTAHRYRIKVDGSVAVIKHFPIGLQVMYLYFPDTPRIIFSLSFVSKAIKNVSETNTRDRVGKNLSDMILIRNDLK